MAISQFSYKIEFVSGVDSGIADSMSRLCRNNMIDSPVEYRPQDICSVIPYVHLCILRYV